MAAEHLAKGLAVQYNEKVTRVEYGESGVTVSTDNGHVFRADAVIFTASLGVLKARTATERPGLNHILGVLISDILCTRNLGPNSSGLLRRD